MTAEPAPGERNAMEIVFKAVLALTTFPTAFGLQPLPNSLASAPPVFGKGAVILLCLGCVVSLLGITWPARDDGLIIQQTGLLGVAAGSICYAAALAMSATTFSSAAIALGMSIGIGFGSIARWVQLQRYVRRRVNGAKNES